MNNHKLLLGAVVVALAIALTPMVSAVAAPNAGTFVKAGDVDANYILVGTVPFAAICFVDLNNDAGQQPSEPVYLSQAACGVAAVGAGDIRLTAAFGKAAGTTVSGADDDLSRNSLATGYGYKYFDADGNGAYNPGDVVYAGLAGPVAINNIALNGANAFTRVTTASPNYNSPTCTFVVGLCPAVPGITAPGANELFFNADGIALYGITDDVYLQLVPGAGAGPVVGDIRLTGLGTVYNGATVVDGDDVDVTITLPAAAPAATSCFTDTNGDGFLSSGEPIYLQFTAACGANSVASGDYRVLATAGKAGGTLVSGSDDDFSRNTIATVTPGGAAPGAILFFDADGSGAYSTNDPIYLDFTVGGCPCTVNVNDVMLSGSSHNTQVTSTSSGLNNAIVAHPAGAGLAGIGVFNADALGGATVVTTGDYLYVPTVVPGPLVTPGVGALRLTTVGTFAPGSYVVNPNVDLVAAVIAVVPAYALTCFIDVDADGVQDPNEPVYLSAACGTVAALQLRLTATAPYQAGTLVKGSDDDFSRVTIATPAAGAYAIYDEDASGGYTNGENLFIDFSAAGPCAVTPNDITVTTNLFTRVTSTSAGINSPVLTSGFCPGVPAIPAVGAEIATETDGLAGFTTGDMVYLDMDASGTVTVGDIRLTGVGGLSGQIGGGVGDGGGIGGGSSNTGSSTSTATSTATSTVTSTATATSTTRATSTAPATSGAGTTSGSGGDDNSTPGFELVALVGALAVALILVRRKL